KSTTIHASPTNNIFLLIYPDGKLWVNYRVRVDAPCNMELSNFPFDTQKCYLTLESYSFNTAKVRLTWKVPAVLIEAQRLLEFEIFNYSYSYANGVYPAGGWDQLQVKLPYFAQ
uniref:Neurotransmitter-gated ion-channel ligand-binding domain-containing protein n=1 Tax=Romanomermis culicivorax TaxID=13658 RepID=A0A915HUE4_ROMCU